MLNTEANRRRNLLNSTVNLLLTLKARSTHFRYGRTY